MADFLSTVAVDSLETRRFSLCADGCVTAAQRRPHFLACFLQMAMYSFTSSGEPRATGAR